MYGLRLACLSVNHLNHRRWKISMRATRKRETPINIVTDLGAHTNNMADAIRNAAIMAHCNRRILSDLIVASFPLI